GVGGTNAHVIIEQFVEPSKEPTTHEEEPLLFKLSARSSSQLDELTHKLLEKLSKAPRSEWGKIAYTLEVGRKNYSHRGFITLSSKEELTSAASQLKNKNHLTNVPPAYLMFPGQGSQYFGMGKTLAKNSLIFKMEVDHCAEILKKIAGYDIREIL